MKTSNIIIIIISIIIIFTCAIFKTIKEGFSDQKNIILLGDSVLNNSAYVSNGRSVSDMLRIQNDHVYNFAKDGSTIQDCYDQLDKIPYELNSTNTYLFLSVGGNDILTTVNRLDIDNLFSKFIILINTIKTKFNKANIIVLNLYMPANPRYNSYKTSVTTWNDMISDYSETHNVSYKILDLYTILSSPDDFVYDIEPSEKASEKIANNISMY